MRFKLKLSLLNITVTVNALHLRVNFYRKLIKFSFLSRGQVISET